MAHKTRPGNAERGWNDPPEFLHSLDGGKSGAQPISSKRTFLNKRVVYPGLESGSGSSGVACTDPTNPPQGEPPKPITGPVPISTAPANATSSGDVSTSPPGTMSTSPPGAMSTSPPPGGIVLFPPATTTNIPKFAAPIIIPTMSPIADSPIATIATNPVNNNQVNMEKACADFEIPDFESDEQMYHFVLTRLKKTCVDCSKAAKPKVIDDVNRKIDIFSDMWKNAKISYPVKSSMARLATALHRRKCDIAHDIHLTLMMDYVSEVGQWMVGIKRLIHEARNIEAPMSPTENSVPVAEIQTKPSQVNNEEILARLGLSDNVNKTPEKNVTPVNNENTAAASQSSEENPSKDAPETEIISEEASNPTDESPTEDGQAIPTDDAPAIIDTSPITS